MLYNTEHNVFCFIIEIGQNYVIIDANGFIYKSTIDSMIII
jgi:hypothetical protein